MSIRFRFTLTLTVVGLVLFGSYALWAYRSESNDLRSAATSELRITGHALETSLGNALRDRQRADVDEMLTAFETLAPALDIHIQDADGRVIAHSRGAPIDTAMQSLVTRAASSRKELVALDPPSDPKRLVFAAPLTADDGNLLGAIVIARPMNDLDEDLERTRDRLLLVVVTFLVVTMAAGLVLGTIHVTPADREAARGRASGSRGRVPCARPSSVDDDEIGSSSTSSTS